MVEVVQVRSLYIFSKHLPHTHTHSITDAKYDIDGGYLKVLRADGTEEKPQRHVYEWGDVALTYFGMPKPDLKPPVQDPEKERAKM